MLLKTRSRRLKPKKPSKTNEDKHHMARVSNLGCIARKCNALPPSTVHHCGTYMGGGRDHRKVIPLCWLHHLGPEGIDGKRMSKREWEQKYGTEEELLAKVKLIIS